MFGHPLINDSSNAMACPGWSVFDNYSIFKNLLQSELTGYHNGLGIAAQTVFEEPCEN